MNKKLLNKIYRETHREEIRQCGKKCRESHKEEIKELDIAYRITHRKECSIKSKKYYKLHQKERLEYAKKYYQNHKGEKTIYNNLYRTNRRKIDINFKILGNLRIRICDALRKNVKSKSTTKLLGCSIDKLKQHLESQFQSGMTWDNYGKWHIDHIRPCAGFDLSKPSEQRKCFNYTNLQPLWAKDNIRKSDNDEGVRVYSAPSQNKT